MKITVLGCGTSAGVPMIGLGFGLCDPRNKRNRRRRCSVYIELDNGFSILIDAGPDIKDQIIDAGITKIDALLLTHPHSDHIAGLDDLRWINEIMKKDIMTYANIETVNNIKNRFSYIVSDGEQKEYFSTASLVLNEIKNSIKVNETFIKTWTQKHGNFDSQAFRINNFAYCTDLREMSAKAFEKLRGVEILILDVLRKKPHKTHPHLDLALEWINIIKPKKTYLTHMDCSMDYDTLMRELPSYVEPAYDGLVINI